MQDGARVMIIDDSRLIGERLQCLLKSIEGIAMIEYQPDLAHAGNRLRTYAPDVLILDHHFPEGSGETLLQMEGIKLDNTHIVLYSAFGSLLNHARYRNLGADVIFDKSESPEALVTLIESILRIRLKQWSELQVHE